METNLRLAKELIRFTSFKLREFYTQNETSFSGSNNAESFHLFYETTSQTLDVFDTLVDIFRYVGYPTESSQIVLISLRMCADFCIRTNNTLDGSTTGVQRSL